MNEKRDIEILRELARKVRGIAAKPVQQGRRELWRQLHGLGPARPMVYVEVGPTGWDDSCRSRGKKSRPRLGDNHVGRVACGFTRSDGQGGASLRKRPWTFGTSRLSPLMAT